MNKAFSIKKADETGLARLSNEIRLLWRALEKPTEEGVAVSTDINKITVSGYGSSNMKFLDESGKFDTIKDSDLELSDITTNNATTTKHGFVPKLPNSTTVFLNGQGNFTVPATASSAASTADSKSESAVTKSDSTDISQSVLISNHESRLIVHGI